MRLYKIMTTTPIGESATTPTKWAASEAGARAAKKELCAEHGLKANGAEYDTVEVGSGKAGLLTFLAEHAKLT